jgi:oxalyl-CoA decarboxylase
MPSIRRGLAKGSHRCADFGTPALINCAIDPTAGTESGHIGNLNPQSSISQKK